MVINPHIYLRISAYVNLEEKKSEKDTRQQNAFINETTLCIAIIHDCSKLFIERAVYKSQNADEWVLSTLVPTAPLKCAAYFGRCENDTIYLSQ